MARVSDGCGLETGGTPCLRELARLVASQMAEAPVVPAVRRAENGGDVAHRVWHRHPRPAAGLQHAGQLAQSGAVVRDVLDHRNSECRAECARGERQPLCGAADPERAVADPLRERVPARGHQPGEGEVAADGERALAGGLDHRVPGSADADVDQRAAKRARGPDSAQIAPAPAVRLVGAVRGELAVEVPALQCVLRVAPELVLANEDDHPLDERKRVPAGRARCLVGFDGEPRGAGRAAEQFRQRTPGRAWIGAIEHAGTLAPGRDTVCRIVPQPSLSVVVPVLNEAAHLGRTLEALLASLERSGFDAELVVVDDGSTDDSARVAREAVGGRLPVKVVRQQNRGRFEARRAGLEAAAGEHVLLLDGRVRIDPDALAFVRERPAVWTGHVDVESDGDLLGIFWQLIAELAWKDYFDDPKETSFGAAEFDRYPKGTTCFFAPRELLLEAVAAFRSRYPDLRRANDDTPLLRWIARRESIHVAPAFSCTYRPRTTLRSFLRHSVHRGVVFLDGHGRRDSRFFPVVVAFYPVSAALLLAAARKPVLAPLALAATSLAAVGLGVKRRRSAREIVSLALVTPVYGLAHGYGMWRGLATTLRQPPAGGPRQPH